MRFRCVCILALGLALPGLAQQKPNAKREAPTAALSVIVLRDSNDKPVNNAEIVLHPVDKEGRQKTEGLELKTHEDGKAGISGIPYGKLRVQVIARGFRTYGADYDVDQPNLDITIKLEKPADQFSIYK